MILRRWLRLLGLGVFFGMVGYPLLSGVNGVSPWAQSPC